MAKKSRHKCETKYCRNKKAVKRNGYTLKHCWKCRSRMFKERHPATYILNFIRQRARRRGIPFNISLSEFKDWCIQTGYIQLRGHHPGGMTVDRIDSTRGYSIKNIRILEFIENSLQGADNTPVADKITDEDPF